MKEKKREAENTLVKNAENGQVKRNIPEISAHWRPLWTPSLQARSCLKKKTQTNKQKKHHTTQFHKDKT